jgi:hypothetical protein
VEVNGYCDARFDVVKEAFAENFDLHGEAAHPSVMVDGRMVVDLWVGVRCK